MTRYARSGSTQRHQKQPGDATPWKKFSQTPKKTKGKRKSIVMAGSGNASDGEQFSDYDNAAESSMIDDFSTGENTTKRVLGDGDETVGVSSKKRKKLKAKSMGLLKNSPSADEEHAGSDGEFARIDSLESTSKDIGDADSTTNKKKAMTKGRKKFMAKVLKNRAKSGIQLLPQPIEDNLYKIKKKLRNQGVPDELVQAVARKERRKAELQLKRNEKTCYNCRKFGHVVANCPEMIGDPEQGTGICFKCGSTEHISRNCHNKSEGFPFAKCYVCHQQGHLSRTCPKNTHGVYPKGGRCNLCGEIDHLKKDCPKLRKKKVEEEVTVGTLTGVKSVDEEMIQKSVESFPTKKKKTKVVKF